MHLIIYYLDHQYSFFLTNEKGEVIDSVEGNEISQAINMYQILLQKADINKIDSVIVSRGPSSFTSLRFFMLLAKTIAISLSIPIKYYSLIDLISTIFHNHKNLQIIFNTGTPLLFLHQKDKSSNILINPDQVDTSLPYTTHIANFSVTTSNFIPWPDINLQIILEIAQDNEEPIYTLLPSYLKSHSEI